MSFLVGVLPVDPVERENVVAELMARNLLRGPVLAPEEVAGVVEMVGSPTRPRPAPRPPVSPRPGGPTRPPRYWARFVGLVALVAALAGCSSTASEARDDRLATHQVNLPDGRVVTCVTFGSGAHGGSGALDCDWLTAGRPR